MKVLIWLLKLPLHFEQRFFLNSKNMPILLGIEQMSNS